MNNLEPKRILHVFGQMFIGGAENRTMEIFREINRDEYQFDFIVMKTNRHYHFDEIEKLGGRIYYIKPPRETSLLTFSRELYKLLHVNKPYGVHAHTSFNEGLIVLVAWLAKIKKRVAHSRSASDINNSSIQFRIYKWIMRKLIILFSTDLVACGYDAGLYLFGKNTMNTGKVKIIPNAININEYSKINESKVDLRLKNRFPSDALIIGTIGNLREVKNHIELIKFFKSFRLHNLNALLVIVGEGPLRKSIEKEIIDLDLFHQVLLLGQRNDIPSLLHTFDVFILPSLFEGVPGVVIEAQAAGIPCLISDTITKEVDLGNGMIKYFSLQSSHIEWEKQIHELLSNQKPTKESSIKRLCEKGYSVSSSTRQITDLYSS